MGSFNCDLSPTAILDAIFEESAKTRHNDRPQMSLFIQMIN